jgi:hypothetical protein
MSGSTPGSPGLDRIVDFPWEILEYRSWLAQQPSPRDAGRSYLFDQPEVRFRPEPGDVLIAERDVSVAVERDGLALSAPRAQGVVSIGGFGGEERQAVVELLRELDGQRPLASVRAGLPGARVALFEALLGAAFGKLIFAPLALFAAERAISGIEITRFPGSPYEIGRSYWLNMGAVRARLGALLGALDDDDGFLRELRRLHVVALMGSDLSRFYQPASPISSLRAAPGRLLLAATEVVDTPQGCLIVAGARVAAAPLGGARYHELLLESLAEPSARAAPAAPAEEGLEWGRLVHARAPGEAADAPWFVPPRPLQRAHLRALRQALAAADHAARAADRERTFAALASFHRLFVRLHPFHCGNQSLAMNIVNGVALSGLGATMPHLMLDHLAFRLGPGAYARLFERAARVYADSQANAASRYQRLASNRTRTFALLEKLDAEPSMDGVRALLRADSAGAELLLLRDVGPP